MLKPSVQQLLELGHVRRQTLYGLFSSTVSFLPHLHHEAKLCHMCVCVCCSCKQPGLFHTAIRGDSTPPPSRDSFPSLFRSMPAFTSAQRLCACSLSMPTFSASCRASSSSMLPSLLVSARRRGASTTQLSACDQSKRKRLRSLGWPTLLVWWWSKRTTSVKDLVHQRCQLAH